MKIELERHSLCVAYILPNLRNCASSVSGAKPKAAPRLPSSLTDLEHHYTDPGSAQNKIRLRCLFREFAELMCRGTRPYRSSPDDVGCKVAVNQRCAHFLVRLITGRIEDHTDPALRTEELAKVYRAFLENQRAVLKEWFGEEVAEHLFQQVLAQISPRLRDVLEQYNLVWE